VPLPEEFAPDGPQKAIFIDADTALVVLNRNTGVRTLIERSNLATSMGGYILKPYETIIAERKRIIVLPHEAVIIRDWQGQLSVKLGSNPSDSAFFLNPYDEMVVMNWSSYTMEFRDGINVPKQAVEKIELRTRKMFFAYQVRTSDNVLLKIEGSVFWKVQEDGVMKMVKATADPEGDVWQHARSAMIQAIGKVKLSEFMSGFTTITTEAFTAQKTDEFYSFRGIETESIQVTRYDCVDPATAEILQEIIEVTTERLKAVEKQEYENTAALLKIQAEITLEDQLTQLIEQEKENTLLQAKADGQAVGYRELKEVVGFLDGLNTSVTNITERVNLFKIQEKLKGRSQDIANLNSGNMNLFYAPSTMSIRMDMSGNSKTTDRRLSQKS
jgi:regulator of protease activity HflC (stomatin/prohibitin superfamily)